MKIERDERRFDFHDIGLAIKRAREASGMTQEQLAYIVDRAPRTIMYNENDGQHPSLNTFYQMVTMFDISVDQFFYPDMSADDACKKRINTLAALTLDRFGYWCYTLNNRNGYCVKRRKWIGQIFGPDRRKEIDHSQCGAPVLRQVWLWKSLNVDSVILRISQKIK